MSHAPGNLLPLAEGIKKVSRVPVIAVGKISPELGEKALQEGKADLIAIGRPLIADPELLHKTFAGRKEDVRPCIGCNHCLYCILPNDRPLRCVVNPAAGREREYAIMPAPRKKKVAVIGGGPAGMEAARVAAIRGHEVSLYEQTPALGGQLLLASVPPYKSPIKNVVEFLTVQLRKQGVAVQIGAEATPALLESKPDAVICAAGVTPLIPDIPGIQRSNVVTAVEVLAGRAEVGHRVVVLGGEVVGCETAEFLVDQGKEVTITRRGTELATKILPGLREFLLTRLSLKGVNILTGVKYQEITDNGLVLTTREGESRLIEADTIVLAAGARPNRESGEKLKGKIPEVYFAGDCVQPRDMADALAEGWQVALKI
jgi:NADPH-dependent 2,4-dienoyl-CoA reductase/sulfur reductase-like enzyme